MTTKRNAAALEQGAAQDQKHLSESTKNSVNFKIDIETAKHYLTALDETAERFTFQTFDDSPLKRSALANVIHGSFEDVAAKLVTLNNKGAGIFITVNETDFKGRCTENVQRVRAVFADMDGAPYENIAGAVIEPHIVVESSPGRWHAYWLVDNLPREQFTSVQKAIAAQMGSDPKVCDLPRVMRVPGFIHRKGTPFVSRLVRTEPILPYDATNILTAFPPMIEPPRERSKISSGATELVLEGGRNNHLTSLAGTMQRRGMSREAILAALVTENTKVCDPPLGATEVGRIVSSVMRYEPVKNIAEPRLAVGRSEGGASPVEITDLDLLINALPTIDARNAARKARSALSVVRFDDFLGDEKGGHDASHVVGYALCSEYKSGNSCDFGGALCREWDERTGGYSFSVYNKANPNHPNPVTTKSLIKLATDCGWDKTFEVEWGEPKPIQSSLKPVQMFDADALLPEILRDWIADEADRMPCPQDYIAAPALVTLGSVIGARCSIKPKALDAWQVVPNLWGGIVAPPSAKKSPAIDAALRPLNRLVTQAIENHKKEVGSFEIDRMVADARAGAIENRIKQKAKAATNDSNGSSLEELVKDFRALKNSAVETPALRRYKTNDTTIEKLGELLRDNPAGLLTLRDELVGLLVSWEREGHEGDRAFYLEGWNGTGSFDTDRIGRGTILIPNLCVSIFGGIQPDKLIAYLEQASHALANDGMLQRFQVLVYPDPCVWDWRDRTPNQVVRDKVFSLYETLASFEPTAWGAAPADAFNKFPYFRFDAEAQGIFVEWSSDLQRNKIPKEDHPIIAQHLAKFEKLFTALALIFHLVECAINNRRGPVMADCALRAAAWCDYLESHARRCYGLLMDEGMRSAQALAERIQRGDLKDGFTARDVRRNQWRYLTTDEAVKAALMWLSDEHWLRSQKVGGAGPGSGRSTFQYLINPAIAKEVR